MVVSNLVVAIFTRKRSFALFCALLRSFVLFCGLALALICVFLRPTAFRTIAFGNCRVLVQETRLSESRTPLACALTKD